VAATPDESLVTVRPSTVIPAKPGTFAGKEAESREASQGSYPEEAWRSYWDPPPGFGKGTFVLYSTPDAHQPAAVAERGAGFPVARFSATISPLALAGRAITSDPITGGVESSRSASDPAS
jgi:hypothetical protein